jgi:uncharacterized protein YjiS (DUF1127 family)
LYQLSTQIKHIVSLQKDTAMAPFVKTGQRRLPLPFLPRLVALTRLWRDRSATRASLARLDTHLLDDIGLSARARAAECEKAPWQD